VGRVMQPMQFESVMERLRRCAQLIGVSSPEPHESIAAYGARILNSINHDDDEHEGIQFAVLVLIQPRTK
jgi:hypothetical protein